MGPVTQEVGNVSNPTIAEQVDDGCGVMLARQCWARVRPITLINGVVTLVARIEPLRTRIGFAVSARTKVVFDVLDGITINDGMPVDGPGNLWLTPSDAAQLTTFDWYAFQQSGADVSIRVYENFGG